MAAPLDLQSELFSATGGAAAEGVSNQLGRPRADRFTLLVREAVQNSWDAKLDASEVVRFQIDGYELDENNRRALADQVFASAPASVDLRARLLTGSNFPILAVSDFGTRGLSGPTRGDIVPLPGESTNFVDFMRYIGRPPNRAYAGGTYGFGKAAYYLASSLKTICVHTCFNVGNEVESRFMAAALGPQFETDGHAGRRFTGRHWWGRMAPDQVVDPIVGEQADELAQLLGGVGRGPNETGTTVYVLAPDFQSALAQSVLSDMGRVLMDYFWPKLVDGPAQTASMSFCVRWQGADLPLPQLHNEPELALLTHAFLAAVGKEPLRGATLETISSQRPKKLLGHAAFVRQSIIGTQKTSSIISDDADSNARPRVLQRPLHHIAVMRAPNFVVKYLEGPPVPYELAEYAGVFRVDSEVDAAFARSEPPTHDDWVPDFLFDPAEKTYVRVAHRRLKEVVEGFAAPPLVEATGMGTPSVAAFSRLLGGLAPSLGEGTRNSSRSPSSSPGGNGTRSGNRGGTTVATQVDFVGEPTTEMVDAIPVMMARFQVSGIQDESVRIVALPKVVVADGFESEPPEGSQQPTVLKWFGPDGEIVAVGIESCTVPAGTGVWTVAVSIPSDAMISLTLKAEALGDR